MYLGTGQLFQVMSPKPTCGERCINLGKLGIWESHGRRRGATSRQVECSRLADAQPACPSYRVSLGNTFIVRLKQSIVFPKIFPPLFVTIKKHLNVPLETGVAASEAGVLTGLLPPANTPLHSSRGSRLEARETGFSKRRVTFPHNYQEWSGT